MPLLPLARGTFASLVAALAGLVVSGCGTEICTADARAGLEVRVHDPGDTGGALGGSGGGGPECSSIEATARDTADDYSEELRCYLVDADCQCSGLFERPGSYTVTVQVGGETEQQAVTIASDDCHVIPQTLTFFEP